MFKSKIAAPSKAEERSLRNAANKAAKIEAAEAEARSLGYALCFPYIETNSEGSSYYVMVMDRKAMGLEKIEPNDARRMLNRMVEKDSRRPQLETALSELFTLRAKREQSGLGRLAAAIMGENTHASQEPDLAYASLA